MPSLFEPLKIRDITFKNRIAVSPMCQYSSDDGFANDWHLAHLGARAMGGAALVICEATAVQAIGRISPKDAGIWKDEHIVPLKRINQFLNSQGAAAGIQLAHAGRKASTPVPWKRSGQVAGASDTVLPQDGGWQVIAPSALQFSNTYPQPREMTVDDIAHVTRDFHAAAARALAAGYEVVEIHAAHGYLLHEFLSPLSNRRRDSYGGSFENRIRIVLEVTRAVREVWPERLPLFARISATDWVEGGWTPEESVRLSQELKKLGVDLIDCSTGGLVPNAKIPVGPGYQVPFAQEIKTKTGLLTGAVGMITEPQQADAIIREGRADMVLLARELLRNPNWPLHAAKALGIKTDVPLQYERAF